MGDFQGSNGWTRNEQYLGYLGFMLKSVITTKRGMQLCSENGPFIQVTITVVGDCVHNALHDSSI